MTNTANKAHAIVSSIIAALAFKDADALDDIKVKLHKIMLTSDFWEKSWRESENIIEQMAITLIKRNFDFSLCDYCVRCPCGEEENWDGCTVKPKDIITYFRKKADDDTNTASN